LELTPKSKINSLVAVFLESLQREIQEYQSSKETTLWEIDDQLSKLDEIASVISVKSVEAEVTIKNVNDSNTSPVKNHLKIT